LGAGDRQRRHADPAERAHVHGTKGTAEGFAEGRAILDPWPPS
jgi:hypothetical protein